MFSYLKDENSGISECLIIGKYGPTGRAYFHISKMEEGGYLNVNIFGKYGPAGRARFHVLQIRFGMS